MKISLSLSLAGLGFPIIFPASDWDNCPLEFLFSAARCLWYQGTHVVVAVWRNLGVNVYKIIFLIPLTFLVWMDALRICSCFWHAWKYKKVNSVSTSSALTLTVSPLIIQCTEPNFLKIIRLSLKTNFYINRHLLHKNTCLLNRLKQDFLYKKIYIYIFLKTFVLTK